MPTDSRHACWTGSLSGNDGAVIRRQNAASASRARVGEPFARAPATIAALSAPALVPESCAIATRRLESKTSRTPQVYAPQEPPP